MGSSKGRASVPVSLERAWGELRDLRNCIHWVPDLARVEVTTDLREGVGASRRVYTKRGPGSGGMDETVTAWREGEGFDIRLHDGASGPPAPFARASFRYAVFAEGERSRIETALDYEMRWGALGSALDALAVGFVTRSMAQRVADGFARHCARLGR